MFFSPWDSCAHSVSLPRRPKEGGIKKKKVTFCVSVHVVILSAESTAFYFKAFDCICCILSDCICWERIIKERENRT